MAMLIQLEGDVAVHKIPLDKENVLLGRAMDNDVTIDDPAVSSHHARVVSRVLDAERGIQAYYLEDLGSTNGSYINEQRVQGQQQLRNDDIISIAFHEFKFLDENEPQEEKTKKIHKSWIPGIFYTK